MLSFMSLLMIAVNILSFCVTGQCISHLTAHQEPVHGLTWLPQTGGTGSDMGGHGDRVLISGDEGGVLLAHDIRSRAPIWRFSLPAPNTSDESHANKRQHGVCRIASNVYGGKCVLGIGRAQGFISTLQLDHPFSKPPSASSVRTRSLASDDIRALLFLPYTNIDTSLLLTTSFDVSAGIWGLRNDKQYHSLNISKSPNTALADDTNKPKMDPFDSIHTDKMLSCCVNMYNEDILTSGADGKVILWSVV